MIMQQQVTEEEIKRIREATWFDPISNQDVTPIVKIREEEIFGVYPYNSRYIVGSMGTIYDRELNRVIVHCIDDLIYVNLTDGKHLVKEMVALTFKEGFNPDKHRVTPMYYSKPSYYLNNMRIVNDGPIGRYPSLFEPYMVEKICQMMSNGMSNEQITQELGLEWSKPLKDFFTGLRCRRIYTDISDRYPNIPTVNKKAMSEEQAEQIYLLSMEGKRPREIAELTGLEYTSSFASAVSRIKKGKIFPNVYQKYNQQ